MSPLQFVSKRWLGSINAHLFRGKAFSGRRPYTFLPLIKKLGIEHVIISGDLSTTSFVKEFREAEGFVARIEEEGASVTLIPGNHDHYTRLACRNRHFYNHFPERYGTGSLKTDRLTYGPLCDGWSLIALDTTRAAGLFASTGYFSHEVEGRLEKAIGDVRAGDRILLLNHFPFFENENPKRHLIRARALRRLLERFPQVQLYLHGHTHRHSLIDMRESRLPIVTDSGSLAHTGRGSWNLIDLERDRCTIAVQMWRDGWSTAREEVYTWD